MKHTFQYKFLCFLLLSLCMVENGWAQKFDVSEYKKRQETTYKKIFSEPAKARQEIELLLLDQGKVPDSSFAMNWNLLGIYYGTNNFLDSAHIALDHAIKLLPEGHPRKMALINNKAIIYRKQKKFQEGMAYLDQAEKFAIQYGDSLMLGTVIGERASYYSAQNLYAPAATNLLRSIQILENNSKTSKINLFKEKQKLANLYSKMAEYQLSENLYKQILPFFKKQGELDTYFISLVNLGDVYLHQNRLTEASEAYQEGWKGLMKFPNRELQIHAMERVAHLEKQQGKYQESITKYRQAFQTALEIGSARLVYYMTEYALALGEKNKNKEMASLLNQIEQISNLEEYVALSSMEEKFRFNQALGNLYVSGGQNDKGVKFLQKALLMKDSVKNEEDLTEARNIQLKYQSEIKDKEYQILKQQNQLQRLLIVIVAILLILFSSFLIWKWYINQANLRIKSIHVEALAKEKSLLNEKLLAEQELVELKEQIINEHRNDLMVKNIENIRLNQKLNDLLKQIEDVDVAATDNKLHILNPIEQDHWDDIILKFKQLNPDFVKKLQQNGESLSKGDIEFCSMARMNMSNKDIARILNISLESVRTKKYRLMKKLNLPDDTNFYNWIMTL